jgi:hypothetical protein
VGKEEAQMAAERVRGIGLQGDEPERLVLSDGSRLVLDTESGDSGAVQWRRVGWRRKRGTNAISVEEAVQVAGPEFSDYVEVRTRAEAGWMLAVSDWYREQAAGLEAGLATAQDGA